MLPFKKIILLGHSGVIGRHLLLGLKIKFPTSEIIALSTREVDLTLLSEAEKLNDIITPETVLFVCSGIKRFISDSLHTFEKNVQIACNLARICEKTPPLRIVYYSSAAVYGETIDFSAITEQTPLNPGTYYGAVKVATEVILRRLCTSLQKTSLTILRPSLVIAPDDDPEFYLPAGFAHQILQRGYVELWGDGTELRDCIDVEDAVQLSILAGLHELPLTLNLARGVSVSYHHLAVEIGHLLEIPYEIRAKDRTRPKVSHGYSIAEWDRIVKNLHFTPLEDSLQKIADFCKAKYGRK